MIPLTPERVAACYEFLRQWPPFCGWHLPPAYAMEFRVSRKLDCYGEFLPETAPVIVVSAALHHQMLSVLPTVAHEMLHYRQHLAGTSNRSQHNAEFRRLAKALCKRHGWDYGQFVGGI
jgi:hypothetical protein